MNTIGQAMAGHAFRDAKDKKAEKYKNPLTDLVNVIIKQVRENNEKNNLQ